MKHTKLPWRIDGKVQTRIVSGDSDTVATTMHQSSLHDEWHGNAAFIVLACNNHERLVEALVRVRKLVDIKRSSSSETERAMRETISEVVTAALDACEVG